MIELTLEIRFEDIGLVLLVLVSESYEGDMKRRENELGKLQTLESASAACPYRARDWSRSVASPPKSC